MALFIAHEILENDVLFIGDMVWRKATHAQLPQIGVSKGGPAFPDCTYLLDLEEHILDSLHFPKSEA